MHLGGNVLAEINEFTRNGWEPSNTPSRAGASIRCTSPGGPLACGINSGTVVQGNYFGLTRGLAPSGNLAYGLILDGVSGVTIGGADPDGVVGTVYNRNSGLLLRNGAANVDVGALLTAFNGSGAVFGEGFCAMDFWASHCDGITALDADALRMQPAAGNLLVSTANAGHGIAMRGGFRHQVQGVAIARLTGQEGTPQPGNGGDGILVLDAVDIAIGFELVEGAANSIEGNGGAGIRIAGNSQAVAVHPNYIHGNAGGGILRLGAANGGIAPPVLTGTAPITGTVSGSGDGVVYLFADGAGQGEFYVGHELISGGNFTSNIDLSGYDGLNLTAVQVRGSNVSAFSAPLPIVAGPPMHLLEVAVDANGFVSSTPAGIACGSDCEHQYLEGTPITLTASFGPGYRLDQWRGACEGPAIRPAPSRWMLRGWSMPNRSAPLPTC